MEGGKEGRKEGMKGMKEKKESKEKEGKAKGGEKSFREADEESTTNDSENKKHQSDGLCFCFCFGTQSSWGFTTGKRERKEEESQI